MTDPAAPPQNLDAEQSVLGAVLLSGGECLPALDEAGLRPEHFYRQSHGEVYAAMLRMEAEGVPVDHLTLRDRLGSDGLLDAVGGPATVEFLAGAVPFAGSVREYAATVRRKAVLRGRLASAQEQAAAAWDEDEERWQRAIAAAEDAERGGLDTRVDPAEDFVRWYEGNKGLPTPYARLTEAIGGALVPGEMSVISAWPGYGKSVCADTFVLHVKRLEPERRCHIYVNEMGTGPRTARMLARITNVPWQAIRNRELDAEQWATVLRDGLPHLPAQYERSHGWPVEEYVRHIRRNRWDLCVIDSASKIPVRDTHALEQMVSALDQVAGATDCHILLLVQLNLERCKTIERPPPLGRDLLGGGAWFRDCRQIFFVHRSQEVMTVDGVEKALPLAESVIYADKATHGEPEKSLVRLRFNSRRMVFDLREPDVSAPAATATAAPAAARLDGEDALRERALAYGEGPEADF